jgi:hypothetical protein
VNGAPHQSGSSSAIMSFLIVVRRLGSPPPGRIDLVRAPLVGEHGSMFQ